LDWARCKMLRIGSSMSPPLFKSVTTKEVRVELHLDRKELCLSEVMSAILDAMTYLPKRLAFQVP
jgi:hypothetical protein